MLKITKRLIIGAFCLSLAVGANAQDKKETKEEVKRVKLVAVDKDGKKYELDEKYTGEMPESLKKKIEEFKAKMKAKGVDLHFNYADHKGDHGKNAFFFKTDDGKAGDKKVKVITMDEDGKHNIVVESIDGELSEELKKKIAELQKNGLHKDGKVIVDVEVDDEVIEIHGDHEGANVNGGRVIVKKDGNVVLDESFEGNMPASLKKKLEEFKKDEEGGEIEIEVKINASASVEGKDGKHKVIKKKMHGGDGHGVIEIKVDGDGKDGKHVWISKDGKDMEFGGEEGTVVFDIDVEEDIDGGTKTTKKVFVFHVLHIEDIKENDEEVPEEFRYRNQPKLDESISDLNFYPNPNDGQFKLNFNLKEKGNTEIAIFDLNGKEIYREQLNDFSGSYSKDVSLQSQPKGLYILKISQGDKVLSKKLVLQ